MTATDYISLTKQQQHSITGQDAWLYHIVPNPNAPVKEDAISLYVDEQKNNALLINELEVVFNKSVSLESLPSAILQKTLAMYYRKAKEERGQAQRLNKNVKAEDFLMQLIAEAKSLGSSDIHVESYEERCRVRMRIDGQLIERYIIEKAEYPSLVNKIKIKASLDISERRLPQDGRIVFADDSAKFDIRVSVLPTLHGEKIVLRLLNNDATNIDIHQMGLTTTQINHYLEGVKKPHGLVLISGPTGSGKTTTLYATLKILNKEKANILTIEDPIEYTLEGVNQVQLKESIGLSFSSALRSFLRQDPDVIMLGEIRDGETAQMAIRAALTGHLVLSTIHTNSAWGTVSRLVDMGVPSYLLASTINTTVAQRLVRLLCPHCKKEESFDSKYFPIGYNAPKNLSTHHVAVGCDECYYTGYKGRTAVYEVIPLDYDLAERVKNNSFDVEQLLKEKGIATLKENAFKLFESGDTSIDEIYPILLNTY